MKKTVISMHERIAVRAYYLSQKYPAASALSCWLLAEQTELQLAERRTAAAAKGADTRRAKAAARAPAEMLIAAKGRLPSRRLTAH